MIETLQCDAFGLLLFSSFDSVWLTTRCDGLGVPDTGVAVYATDHVSTLLDGKHVVDEFLVAIDASMLYDVAVAWLNLNGILIVASGKRERMEESVVRFGDPLANRMVGQMAVIACRDCVMAGFQPRIVLRLHHVTVRARLRVVAQIGVPFTVSEGEDT